MTPQFQPLAGVTDMVREAHILLQYQNMSLSSEMKQHHVSQCLGTLHAGAQVSVHAPTDMPHPWKCLRMVLLGPWAT